MLAANSYYTERCVRVCMYMCVYSRVHIYVKHETVCQRQVDGRVRCFVRRFIGLYARAWYIYEYICMCVCVYVHASIYLYLYKIFSIYFRKVHAKVRNFAEPHLNCHEQRKKE